MTDLLFVYGTLLQKGNLFADYLSQNCTYLSSDKIKGLLYDIGEYPGLIITSNMQGYVHGNIFKLHQPAENLKIMDDYEGVGIDQEQPNLYVRKIIQIETVTGFVDAWVYVYNLPVNGLPLITSGNYMEYLEQKKSPGY